MLVEICSNLIAAPRRIPFKVEFTHIVPALCYKSLFPVEDDFSNPKRSPSTFKSPLGGSSNSRAPLETIILDDSDILTIKRGNEIRFQKMRSRPNIGAAKFTSTPEDRPYQNGTSEDDDVILVKETKPGSQGNAPGRNLRNNRTWSSLLGDTYLKPFTGSSYLKSLQNGGCTSQMKESIRPRLVFCFSLNAILILRVFYLV